MSGQLSHMPSLLARHLTLIGTSAFMLAPFLWMVSLSLKPPSEAFAQTVYFWPNHFYGYENYRQALVSSPLARFMLNGAFICIATLILQILVAAPMAYALAKLQFRGRDVLFGFVLVALLIPPEVLAIPLFILLHYLGLLNSYAALILPGTISPFAIFLLRQYFKAIPDDFLDAARLDGLSEWAIIWRVMVPLSVSAVVAFSLLSIVGRWNDLFWPMTVIRSEQLMTPAMGIVRFRNEEMGSAYGPLMAAAVVVVAPMVILFLAAQKRFVEGLTTSGLK
ncbi:carbohydrate ABC transporter permease [Pseudochelatococcus sp. B33]